MAQTLMIPTTRRAPSSSPMSIYASPGETNPNAMLDAKTVRKIRLLHLCDGISASQISRDLKMNVSCISRIVNWKSWAHQDHDLKVIPKPANKGGNAYHIKPKDYNKLKRPERMQTCRDCLHLTERGNCGLGFPECHSTAFKEAAKCNAFVSIHANAGAPSDV